ncbi:uncharacterized protein LOC143912728 isoform X2 [Arctopsyche grandis]|uniref:uncharacterized protein LOC143912728 isoform X2 n=1 Tax=Arctopsyche grandis TaxID=121162 RepID=UPI00406D6797
MSVSQPKKMGGEGLRVVVLGGCGFIGRNLVEHLVINNLASIVRAVDKVPPQIAWLNKKHTAIFENPKVEYKSANLINPASCRSALEIESDSEPWDLVVNCAGETKNAQSDAVYKEGIFTLSMNCVKECARLKVKRYIEITSGCMFSSEKIAHSEDGLVEPWTFVAKWKSQVETEMEKLSSDLDYTIVRPAIVYGSGDRKGITPRLLVGAIYKQLGEMMKLMWTADLKLNTIHVIDLCRAITFLAEKKEAIGQTYNVVDKGETTQGKITDIVSNIFNINHDYWGTAMSSITDLASIVDDVNDKHLASWAEACASEGIQNTPLDPTMTTELLLKKHINLDGSKLCNLGFKYEFEVIIEEKIREIIDDYIEMGVFPKCLASC